MKNTNIRKVATIEARMSSSRLPGKVLMPLAQKPALERMVERVKRSTTIDEIVLATTVSPKDDALVEWAKDIGLPYYRGSEEDVLKRVLETAQNFKADVIVELTGDCPLIDPNIIDELMQLYMNGDADYVSNILTRTYPRGLDTQIFSTKVLSEVDKITNDPADRENVSLYIYEHPKQYKLRGIEAPAELYGPDRRWCIDTEADYEVIKHVFDSLIPHNNTFNSLDVMNFLNEHPEIQQINKDVIQKKARI